MQNVTTLITRLSPGVASSALSTNVFGLVTNFRAECSSSFRHYLAIHQAPLDPLDYQ